MQTNMIPIYVQFSGMAFAAVNPEHALQFIADTLSVSTVAICRYDTNTAQTIVLAQNANSGSLAVNAPHRQSPDNSHSLILDEDAKGCDFLMVQSSFMKLSLDQIDTLDRSTPYLASTWRARSANFEYSLSQSGSVPTSSILHPDNPYNLTRTELRVCSLIADAQKPKAIAQSLKMSMPTIRTHLRHIYAKTGLDGMFGVLHNLQSNEAPSGKAA